MERLPNKNAPAVEQARIILHSAGAKKARESKNKPSKSCAYYTLSITKCAFSKWGNATEHLARL
jgi:hypothetical protein